MSNPEPDDVRSALRSLADKIARRYLWAVFHTLEEQVPAAYTMKKDDGTVIPLLTGPTQTQASYRAGLCSTLLGRHIQDVNELSADELWEAGKRALEANNINLKVGVPHE